MLKEDFSTAQDSHQSTVLNWERTRTWDEAVDENSGVWERPYSAIATDFDGVVELYGKETKDEADRIRTLLVEKTVKSNIPLAFITGKDERDVGKQIIAPIREMIKNLGVDLPAGRFMVYANNGSVTIDAGLDNQVIERKEFRYEDLEKISQLEVVEIMMAIYELVENIREKIPEAFKHTRFRVEKTTLGFSMRPEDLKHPAFRALYRELKKLAGKESDLNRFDIGQIFSKQLAQADLPHIQIAVTDGAVDLTPGGTGKRNALENFAARTKTNVEDILRMGDNGDGSDYQLLAPKGDELRGGFANTALDPEKLETLQQQNPGFKTPKQLENGDNQFRKVINLLEKIAVVPARQ